MKKLPVKKIFIADDHLMMIDGIISLLSGVERFEIAGTALDGRTALEQLHKKQVDILITDISMPEFSGIELTREVRKIFPDMMVLVLSMYNESGMINEIMEAGAHGYILKNTGKEELLTALDSLVEKGKYWGDAVVETMMKNMWKSSSEKTLVNSSLLTDREKEVLILVVKEFSSVEIAGKLFISLRTVETHRKNILRKTGAKNLAGLVKYAYQAKLA